MAEWDVVLVIVSLIGLFAVVAKPLAKAVKAMTELTVAMEQMRKSMDGLAADNKESHKRIWEHNQIQDGKINDHEFRIHDLEEKQTTK
jgi:uncharacterized protein YoxC